MRIPENAILSTLFSVFPSNQASFTFVEPSSQKIFIPISIDTQFEYSSSPHNYSY
ncbi:Uncharacterised protein [Klebsiella pneumoniae]|uniref:Uncharacterized protein n=2 Tax=Klebsiella pneumoniae TaxID=573 RepID=A0A378UCQ6_KLEPO|nr:Uncharacterised protein [Klebsiella pneumoniae]STZ75107.1 Uncharacterised protein [Klebsiella pneumoniae subsp. ozaenae]